MAKRETNREVAYLKEETQQRLLDFVKLHPTLKSKSRVIELALDFYLTMAIQYGLDDRWQPNVQVTDTRIHVLPKHERVRRSRHGS